jgi:rubrerythrin
MDNRFYKELWSLRFEKMLKLENDSVVAYQALLKETKKHFKNHSIVAHLERLITDEKKHALLVEELIHILEKQPD